MNKLKKIKPEHRAIPLNLRTKIARLTKNGNLSVDVTESSPFLCTPTGQFLRWLDLDEVVDTTTDVVIIKDLYVKWSEPHKSKWRYLSTLPSGECVFSRLKDGWERIGYRRYRVPEFLITTDISRLEETIYPEEKQHVALNDVEGYYPDIIDRCSEASITAYGKAVGSLRSLRSLGALDKNDIMYIIKQVYTDKKSVYSCKGIQYPSIVGKERVCR